jgi:drug/metabolite transporter (DMT)-like permease
LVNYLWPLGIVVLGPVFFPANRLRWHHIFAALAGFAGAAIAIVGRSDTGLSWSNGGPGAGFHSGYLLAAAGALVWSCYSLMTRRLPRFPTAAVGGFAAASGVLALLCHALLEPAVTLSVRDAVLLAVLGLGPLGGAFYLWDAALKRGEPRRIGLLAFATPILSTVLLLLSTGQGLHWNVGLAAVLVVGGALWGSRN